MSDEIVRSADVSAYPAARARHWLELETEPLLAFCERAGRAFAEASPWFLLAGGSITTAEQLTWLLLSFHDPTEIDLVCP